jgi:hypothetical protein
VVAVRAEIRRPSHKRSEAPVEDRNDNQSTNLRHALSRIFTNFHNKMMTRLSTGREQYKYVQRVQKGERSSIAKDKAQGDLPTTWACICFIDGDALALTVQLERKEVWNTEKMRDT